MLHRIGILPVVQKVVLELRWMNPDLHENIRICYPYGNYEYDNIIYVEKK